jgi:hypothetical protein
MRKFFVVEFGWGEKGLRKQPFSFSSGDLPKSKRDIFCGGERSNAICCSAMMSEFHRQHNVDTRRSNNAPVI